MSYEADRMRDLIAEVAAGELGDTDLGKLLDSVSHYTETSVRAITALFDAVTDHGDAILALSNRVEGVFQHGKGLAEVMVTEEELRHYALLSDLADLEHTVRDLTATPFDPPEAA